MTTYLERELTCKVCGARSSHHMLASTNALGSPDLDSRPPPMARRTCLQILECKECGYCAPDLSQGPEDVGEIVRGEPYRTAAAGSPGRELACQWHRWSLVMQHSGDRAGAGWACLRAAWASDDARDEEAARAYRTRALEHLSACVEVGTPISEDEVPELVLLDLHRRLGHDAEALRLAEVVTLSSPVEATRDVAQFQTALVELQDRRRYTVQEAREYAEAPAEWSPRAEPSEPRRWWQFWK